MGNAHTRAPAQRPMATGPVSRLARVVLAAVVGAGVCRAAGPGATPAHPGGVPARRPWDRRHGRRHRLLRATHHRRL
jgi:hypothetical protein